MSRADLRLVKEDGECPNPPPKVRLRLGEVLDLLIHAQRRGHAWLTDMSNEEIDVSQDLAILLARFKQIVTEKRA